MTTGSISTSLDILSAQEGQDQVDVAEQMKIDLSGRIIRDSY